MIWSISWKNVWRNKTRSMVVIVAVTLGLFGGVFSGAVLLGMVKQRVSSAIENEVSHIQIHHPEYFSDKETQYTFNYKPIVEFAKNQPGVVAVSPRTKIMAIANTSGKAGTGIMLYGINPEIEKQTTRIFGKIRENGGDYFETKSKLPTIVISDKIAKKLKVVKFKLTDKSFEYLKEHDIDDEIIDKLSGLKDKPFRREKDFIQTVTDSLGYELDVNLKFQIPHSAVEYKLRSKIILNFVGYDGGLVQSAFRLVGVYKTSNLMFDELSVFVEKSDLDIMAGINPDEAHEVAILCNDFEASKLVYNKMSSQFKDLSVQEWSELQPDLKVTTEYMNIMFYILTLFILLALGFGIVNTMLMAILERIKELGMLMAVGMNKIRVFSMIMLESVFLTLTGGLLGIVLSTLIIMFLENNGLDLRALYGEGLESVGYSAIIYPEISAEYLFGTTILVIATGLIASIYPALKAIKLNPAEAIRTDN